MVFAGDPSMVVEVSITFLLIALVTAMVGLPLCGRFLSNLGGACVPLADWRFLRGLREADLRRFEIFLEFNGIVKLKRHHYRCAEHTACDGDIIFIYF